ncbi:MAG: sugar ABC transporter permease [Candidatus Hydrogenedentota bacterium]
MTSKERRNLRNGLLFISPWIFGFAVFIAYPLGASLYYSFCDYSVLKPPVFIGTANFQDLFTDPVFWKSLYNTLYFAVFFLPVATVLAIALALLLNTGVRGMTVYRTIFFLPSLTPLVALGILWMWMLNGDFGVVNYVLNLLLNPLGLEAPIWLQSTTWAKPAIILMSLWGVGRAVVIYLAGLQVSGTTPTWNVNNGLNAEITLSDTTTITMSNLSEGETGNLTVTNAATAHTIDFAGYTVKVSPVLESTGGTITMSGDSEIDVLSWWYDGTYLIIDGTLNYD